MTHNVFLSHCCTLFSKTVWFVVTQDENAVYYKYRYVTNHDEAMSYWVDVDQHSTVFYQHYRKALVGLRGSLVVSTPHFKKIHPLFVCTISFLS